MAKCGIYRIRNIVSGRSYVGQSRNIERRWKKHLAAARAGKNKTALLDAIRAYGADGFEFSIIEECPVDQLDARERFWIAEFDCLLSGYNHLDGGGSGPRNLSPETRERYRLAQLGKRQTPEHRERIGLALRGRKVSEAARANMSAGMRGRKFSPEHKSRISAAKCNPSPEARQRMSEAQLGRVVPDEIRAKLSAARKGVPKSPEHRARIAAALMGNNNRKNGQT